MAVKRRIPKRRIDVTDEEECWLRDEPCGFIQFIEDEKLDKLWNDHRERIIAEHIADYPGTRPHRWWERDAPGELGTNESQAAYLKRHGLLLPAERRRLRRGDFEPAVLTT